MPAIAFRAGFSRARMIRLADRCNRWVDGWIPAYRRHLAPEFKRQWEEAADALEAGNPPESLLSRWENRLFRLELRLGLPLAVESAKWATKVWFGSEKSAAGAARGRAAPEIPESIEVVMEHDALLARKLRPALEERLRSTITLEASATRKKIAYWTERLRDSDYTVAQIGRELRKLGILHSKARADLIARTSTIWNYAEGTQQAYRDAGLEVGEWLATSDDLTCDFCMEMDGLKFRLGTELMPAGSRLVVGEETLNLPLATHHPPLHPNCRCAIIPDVETVLLEEPPVGVEA